MAGKTKKDINDPAFFDDAHMDEHAEPISVPDPDAGVGDDADEPVAVDDDEPADDGDEAPSDDDGELVDEDAATDDDVADAEGDSDPAPQLKDLDTAKVAYAEVRKWANERDMAARKLEERIQQLEAENQVLTEFDYGVEPEPQYDPNAFAQMAGQDPRAAFDYALQNGNTADARAAIAQVEVDVAELAAVAASALRDKDEQAYHHYRSQASNAAAIKMELEGKLEAATLQRSNAPLVEAENKRTVEWAWNTLNQQTQGDLAARAPLVQQVLKERPHLVQGNTPEAVLRGYQDAYALAQAIPAAQPAPGAALTLEQVEAKVTEMVSEKIEATRRAKAAAAESAGGASGTRAGGATTSGTPSAKDEIYGQAKAASMGARAFMDL